MKGQPLFEFTFLGTSASAPSIHRGLSAHVLKHNEHRFLIDCGEGTQRQILQSGLGFKHLDKVLITHSHLDHILGLAGLVSTYMRWEAIEKLDIYAGRASNERIRDLLYSVVLRNTIPPMPLNLIDIQAGTIFDEDDFSVVAFPVIHRGADNFGFVFEEKSRQPFLVEKADELGVPAGPLRGDLVKGKAVTLADGRTILPGNVLGPFQKGIKLVHVGDTGSVDNLLQYCMDADLLVIESTYLDAEADMAREFAHLTARKAAEFAVQANIKRLVLTHISRRYREKDILNEAQEIFPNTAVARDFDEFKVVRE